MPVFSEQQPQHFLDIITNLAGQIKDRYLRTTIGETIFVLKTFTQIEYSRS
jgi:hypothetical protein